MQKVLPNQLSQSKIAQGILSTLAFFDIYRRPASLEEIYYLLYGVLATKDDVNIILEQLVTAQIIFKHNNLYALTDWQEQYLIDRQQELELRLKKVQKYLWVLSLVPFVAHVSLINSVAMGAATKDSDIDFFVVTKKNRLYFVRTIIIILFRLLGLYKTGQEVRLRFCFGFYVDTDHLDLQNVMLKPTDPYFVFWLGTMQPLINAPLYMRFIKINKWIYKWLPNFNVDVQAARAKSLNWTHFIKKMLEFICFIPAWAFEPVLRRVHIRHTNKRPENHWKTSTTIAEQGILKLHALDVRRTVRSQHQEILAGLRVLPKNN